MGAAALGVAGADAPQTMQEFRKMLEETKKEVRDIRAIEAQMRWNMTREEKKSKVVEAVAEESEIRDWRWQQADEMKAYVEEKDQIIMENELLERKDFVEFKREAKAQVKEEEREYVEERYQQDVENAAWRAELAKEVIDRDKQVAVDRQEDVQVIRDKRAEQRVQEKLEVEDQRQLEQSLEMAKMARELAREKEELLRSLEYVRSCQKPAPLSGGSLNGSRGSSGGYPMGTAAVGGTVLTGAGVPVQLSPP